MINPQIEELIAKKVLAEAEDKEPSGRMSASRLGNALQWQMLHHFKVKQKPIDEYTLRKFQRGKDVEERVMKWVAADPEKMQVPVTYRGVVGIMDLLLDYPIEVKSVTNMKFKRLQKDGPQRGHRLQGMLYAKALGYDKYGVAYVASDDYRVLCFELPVTNEVDEVIDAYEAQLKLGTVPEFVPMEKWQSNEEYNPYPEWMKLTEEEIAEKLKEVTGRLL
jgi:hypothetical protein